MAGNYKNLPQVGRDSGPKSHSSGSSESLGCPIGSGGGNQPVVAAEVAHLASADRNVPSAGIGGGVDPFARSGKLARSPPRGSPAHSAKERSEAAVATEAVATEPKSKEVERSSGRLMDLELMYRRMDDCDEEEGEQIRLMSGLLKKMKSATDRQKNISMDVKSGLAKMQEVLDFLEGVRRTRLESEKLSREIVSGFVPPDSPLKSLPGRKRRRARSVGGNGEFKGTEDKATMTSPRPKAKDKSVAREDATPRERKTPQRAKPQPRPPAVAPPETSSPWTTVGRDGKRVKAARTKKKKRKVLGAGKSSAGGTPNIRRETPAATPGRNKRDGGPQRPRTKTRRRPRRNAVVIKPAEGKSFAEVVGAIRKDVKPEDSGTEVRRIRRTRDGDVLLELERTRDADRLQQAISAAVGASGHVRSLTPRIRLEVLDLDVCATDAEILDAIGSAAGEAQTGEVKVSLFAPNARGERVAVVDLSEAAGLTLLDRGKMRVGWVNCRIRRRIEVLRCYRCLGYGHTRRECKGPDRSADCWRCGAKGHSAKSCTGTPSCRICAEKGSGYPSNHVQGSGACRTFREILSQRKRLVYETDPAVVFASEPLRSRDGPAWYPDILGTCALWVVKTGELLVEDHGSGEGFAWVKCQSVTFVSCYLSPNDSITRFREKLEALEDTIRGIPGKFVVAGDFNARAVEWGMPHTDTRGRLLLEMASRLGLAVLNEGNTPTFRRPGFGESIPDVTLASEELATRISGWRVMGDYTGSDHEYITFRLEERRRGAVGANNRRPTGWNVAKLSEERLGGFLALNSRDIPPVAAEIPSREEAEAVVESTSRLIKRACDASMPRKRVWNGRKQVHWWTDQIADLRRECRRLRRKAQRMRTRPEAAVWSERHKAVKKELVRTIRKSKARCWRELCEDVDRDPWGKGYKLVMRKLAHGGGPPLMDADTMMNIVDGLFPTHPLRRDPPAPVDVESIPLFTVEELQRAVASLKTKKAPGPDGVPSEALKVVARCRPNLLLGMYNTCLKAGVFASRWKKARLVLLSKGKGPPNAPSSYRPLCMLDTAGKVMEKLLKPRLQEAIRAAGDLSERQHGFREGHSTVSAIAEVVAAVARADQACHAARPVVLLVTLDVRNAFNSARWSDMLEALERAFEVPDYLMAVMRDYLKNRGLWCETAEGIREVQVTSGAAQGSILGPDLWNVSYDRLLRTEMPDDCFLVGYADDIAAVITSRTPELAQLLLNQVMRRVNRWMDEHGLQLAIAKTEIVMLTRRRIPTVIPMTVGAEVVQTKRSAKYLGVMLDCKLTYWDQIRQASDKAAAVTVKLSRLMANVGGPSQGRRRLLLTTAQSILLYGAEIWADATRVRKYRTRMLAVQRRGALRIASCYRTVSESAALVVAGVVPIDLLAQEKKLLYTLRTEMGRAEAVELARARTMTAWQRRWDEDTKGRWTATLVGNLGPWIERSHGEVNFYLTQFLTGHGYFRLYLHRMGKVANPMCTYCVDVADDARHTFFVCERFAGSRRVLDTDLGGFDPGSVVEKMLQSTANWDAVTAFVGAVLKRKREDGCLTDP